MKIFTLFFVLTISFQVRSVTINFPKVQGFINQSCTDSNITFKKAIWDSGLSEAGDYTRLLTLNNECISRSDKLYLELYYQYKNETI